MNKALNAALSMEIAEKIKSKANQTFDNAYKAVLATDNAKYVQGFLVVAETAYQPIEHSWIEISDTSVNDAVVTIIDPTLPHLHTDPAALWYFAAHSLSVKQLTAIVEESKEDYPEDHPLPIYGEAPYKYYGNVMLGGEEYLVAFQAAEAKCQEIRESQ
ncbi:hypothetical protein VB620_05275 [Nodularia harveyana UHCC-0300]|uniref:Uncharacterized protein n=1 Tax=Nodularia harveyana UHCC-0300 TaxID=2974287 RepID=A0ABU5UB57_9CYAN|nr:hypothetical protein [Nodularia harveyana]MEA5580752.1 hypothetical protein [Nodularia harveyana UHCC-0300]